MLIVGIDHVQLAMPPGGEPEARQFYGGLLGLREVPKPEKLSGRGGCWFESEGVRVHLGVEHDFRAARKAHPALLVSDLPALIDRLASAGVATSWPDEPLGSPGHVYADDPFGNRLELIEA